ncbi:hypothetical protein P691DRAFT_25772 [Macrolepiota fuliginosa MF-IS2]|uniref:Uncharacterized protein n=1 Tax=Macrolepiota fuliginosa MF-IS2 TaxID=1400762 RepID=A0A9P6C642_9AGAR|nr:hypothetical protein P691DRAFT_25772 [Macrolepiota fuliginosa MF-IS2]
METFRFFNDFPNDVQRLIFEHAFESGSAATSLALVSWKVNKWVEPLIYQIIDTSRMLGHPRWDTTSRKPRNFYHSHVKSLSVDGTSRADFLKDILSECRTNLVSLAWWPVMSPDRGLWASILLKQEFPSMRKFSVYCGMFTSEFQTPLCAPIFQNLTHLDIGLLHSQFPAAVSDLSGANTPIPAFLEGLQSLESLLHLHLDMMQALGLREADAVMKFQSAIPSFMSHLPNNLRYLSIYLPFGVLSRAAGLPDHSRQIYDDLIRGRLDPRVVVAYPSEYSDVRVRGKAYARISKAEFGEYLLPRIRDEKICRVLLKPDNDFWDAAEEMVNRRNKGINYGR